VTARVTLREKEFMIKENPNITLSLSCRTSRFRRAKQAAGSALAALSLPLVSLANLPEFTSENIRRAESVSAVEVRKAIRVPPRVIHVYHVHNMHQNFVIPMWPQMAERINTYQEHVYNYIRDFNKSEMPEVFVEFLSEGTRPEELYLYPNVGDIGEMFHTYLQLSDPVQQVEWRGKVDEKKKQLEEQYRYLPGGEYRAFKDGLCELLPAKNREASRIADAMSCLQANMYRANYKLFVELMDQKEDIALEMIAKHAKSDHVILVYGGAHDFLSHMPSYRSHIGARTITERDNVKTWNKANPNVQIRLHNVDPTRVKRH
jgi:hypothetical protein